MRIWIIQTGEILPLQPSTRRMRSGMVAEQLGLLGHEVVWWVSGFDHLTKKQVITPGSHDSCYMNVRFEVLLGCGYKKNISIRRLIDHLQVASQFKQRAPQLPAPDLIISSLPEHNIAYFALRFAKGKGVPFILDLRDLWPDFFLSRFEGGVLHALGKIILGRDYFRSRAAIRDADALFTMMPSFLQWSYTIAGRKPVELDKVYFLGAPRCSIEAHGESNALVDSAISNSAGCFVVIFVGSFSNRSYPKYLLEAASKIYKESVGNSRRIHFIIAGDGDYLPAMRVGYEGVSSISFTGWVNEADIFRLLASADVGVVTANEPMVALPNKVFTYLSAALPIINCVQGDSADLVDSWGCGTNVMFNDVGGLVAAIQRYAKSSQALSEAKANAAALFDASCDSSVIYSQYARDVISINEYLRRKVNDIGLMGSRT